MRGFAFKNTRKLHQENTKLIESVKNMTKVIGEQKETIDLFRIQNKELIEALDKLTLKNE